MVKRAVTEAVEESFAGFPAGALPFLRRLKRNNDRVWFAERKDEYESLLLAPMLLLVRELAGSLHDRELPLAPSQKLPVFRIYRDIRFSKDKTPLKTHISSVLHRDGDKRVDGMLYVHIDPVESFVAAGFWQPDRAALGRWRERIAAEPGPLLRFAKGMPLDDEDILARMPRGFERYADAPAEHLLRLKSFLTKEAIDPAALRSRAVVDLAVGFAKRAEPLLRYGWEAWTDRAMVDRFQRLQ